MTIDPTHPSLAVQFDLDGEFDGFQQLDTRTERIDGTMIQKFKGASHDRLIELEQFVHDVDAFYIENLGEASELTNGWVELVFMTDDLAYLPGATISATFFESEPTHDPIEEFEKQNEEFAEIHRSKSMGLYPHGPE